MNGDQVWRNDPCLLVLANGDCTGLSYHADFHNGVSRLVTFPKHRLISPQWDVNTLQDTINQCGLGKGPGDALDECAPLAKTLSMTAMKACRLEGQIPDDYVRLHPRYFHADGQQGRRTVCADQGPSRLQPHMDQRHAERQAHMQHKGARAPIRLTQRRL
jgi:hypothetical protein